MNIGDAADGMYFIEDGTVSIRIEQDAGEVEISVLGKGQYFGELALVTHRPRAASAYAASDVKVACEYSSCFIDSHFLSLHHIYAALHTFGGKWKCSIWPILIQISFSTNLWILEIFFIFRIKI